MKLTCVIQMNKNVFAVNNGIIVLTFPVQDLTKGCGRGLRGPGPDPDAWWRLGRQMRDDFSNRLGRQMKGNFSNGPGWFGKREMSSTRA